MKEAGISLNQTSTNIIEDSMKKVRGFTLVEILIGMLLSSILISIVLIAVSLLNQTSNSFTSKWRFATDVSQIQMALQNDLCQCDIAISLDTESLYLKGEDNISYKFISPYIVRTVNEVPDTILLEFRNLKFNKMKGSETLVESCRFLITRGESEYPVTATKEYDKVRLYNTENNQ